MGENSRAQDATMLLQTDETLGDVAESRPLTTASLLSFKLGLSSGCYGNNNLWDNIHEHRLLANESLRPINLDDYASHSDGVRRSGGARHTSFGNNQDQANASVPASQYVPPFFGRRQNTKQFD
jgi:hypothetical protein